MRKIILLISFLFCISLLLGVGEGNRIQLARLQYEGGGDWYNDPELLPNLAQFTNENINTAFSSDQATVKAADAKLYDYPFLFATGHGNIKFTDKEIQQLRDYLLKGGFLYADDDYGMDGSFRRECKRLFPEKELVELPPSHALFHCWFNFPKGIPKIHRHDDGRPQAFGIFDDDGRLMVLYTYQTNISDGWANADTHQDPPELRQTALRMGANILYYILTQK